MEHSALINLLLGSPGKPPRITDAVSSFINRVPCTEAQCAYAFVSLSGVNEAFGKLCEEVKYKNLNKRWIVGIHNGITEPAAIETLFYTPKTLVKIFTPTKGISKGALYGNETLHPKSILIKGGSESLVVVGSANLTRAAVGSLCTNYEASAVLRSDNKLLHKEYSVWFNNIWSKSISVTPALIDKYSSLRDHFLRHNKVIVPRLDEIPDTVIGTKDNLWIEAGAMSGGDRNQVEFGPILATFFGPLRRGTINIRLKWKSIFRNDRPLSYKVTKWNTEIWRLSMITSNQGGPDYPDMIIHFTRKKDNLGDYFELDVAPPNSPRAKLWRRHANRRGTLAVTGFGGGSAREYGVY